MNFGSNTETSGFKPPIKLRQFQLRKILTVIIIIVLLAVLSLGSFYTVDTDEIAVVYTMGNPTVTTGPGPHFKVPFIQTITKARNPQAILPIYIGYRDLGNQNYQDVPDEATMITADENILNIDWMVEVNISDANKSMYRCSDPIEYIRSICLSDMRSVVNAMSMDTASTVGREQLSTMAFPLIDKHLKDADIGYVLKNIRIQDIQPPDELVEAYALVNTAQQKRAEEINKAQGEKAQVINAKQSDVAKRKANADAETNRIVNNAKGETAEYFAMYNLYSKNKDMTKSQMLMGMLEKILPKAKIYILDGGGSTVKYINLDELKPQSEN